MAYCRTPIGMLKRPLEQLWNEMLDTLGYHVSHTFELFPAFQFLRFNSQAECCHKIGKHGFVQVADNPARQMGPQFPSDANRVHA